MLAGSSFIHLSNVQILFSTNPQNQVMIFSKILVICPKYASTIIEAMINLLHHSLRLFISTPMATSYHDKKKTLNLCLLGFMTFGFVLQTQTPNIVLIFMDDPCYGDIGAKSMPPPPNNRISTNGDRGCIRFTNFGSSSRL